MVIDDHSDGQYTNGGLNMIESYLQKQGSVDFAAKNYQEERAAIIKTLPIATKRRISAMKKLVKEYLEADLRNDKEIHHKVCEMHSRLASVFKKSEALVNGEISPSDADLYLAEGEESLTGQKGDEPDEGVPDFWLTVLKSNNVTGDLIQPHDEPILAKMTNAKVVWRDQEPMGFTLEFEFAPNEYFSNRVLTKTYHMKFEIDENEPFAYNGPEITRSEGCTIDWLEGKNVTCKTVKKRQKQRRGTLTRVVTRNVKIPSFFNFFTVQDTRPEEEKNEDELEDDMLDEDHEIGEFLKAKLIPMAVLYYTGEAEDADSLLSDSDSEEYEDTEDDSAQDVTISVQDLIE